MIGQALILAGGFGSRLKELVADRPKPMAPVCDRPFLEYLLCQLKKNGLSDIILSVGHLGHMVQQYFGNGERWGVRLTYSEETEPLGTAGAVKLAGAFIKDSDFVVLNGDSFFDIDLRILLQHHAHKRCLATIALAMVESTDRFGSVKTGEEGNIVEFEEKRIRGGAGLINAGIYVVSKRLLALIPEGRAASLERDVFPKIVGLGFCGVPFQSYFVDIGRPDDYLSLQADPHRLLAALK